MLVALFECKLPHLNDTRKDQKLTTDFEKGVMTPLITPCIFENECFDMLKSIGFGELVRLFSSFR